MYCSIDIETTGLDCEKHQILEVAAVLATSRDLNVMEMPWFLVKIKWDELNGTPRALSMNRRLIDPMADSKITHEPTFTGEWVPYGLLGRHFTKWLDTHLEKGVKVFPCGKNYGSFDRGFLYKVPGWPKHRFGHRTLDPGSMWATWESIPSLDSLGFVPGLCGVEHEALFDARKALYWSLKALDKSAQGA